jgi:hypothetical protein
MTHRVSRIVASDEGIALLTVIGVMLVVTALSIGSFTLAQQVLHTSVRLEDESRAYRAATSGLDTVLSDFTEDTAFPIAGTTPDGSYSVDVLDLGGGEFRLVSTAIGLDETAETVTQQFYYMNLWKMNFAGTGPQSLLSGTSGFNGTSNILGPFYMKGNFRVDSNMTVREGPLFVRGGSVSVASSGLLGTPSHPIKVFCNGDVPSNTGGTTTNRGVYVSTMSRSVPDITLPVLDDALMQQWATKAQAESVDNIMGPVSRDPQVTSLEVSSGNPGSYTTIQPPNSGVYKFIGPVSGEMSPMGQGNTHLTIGGSTFGSWGSLSTTDGVTATGDGHYPLSDVHDDFAYDDVNDILYIEGTVFVDGSVTIAENMTYVGNGSIIANGDIRLNGSVRPRGTNVQGENHGWALGLVTPTNMYFDANDANNYSTMTEEMLRASAPTFAGAFYAQGAVAYLRTNMSVRGSIIAGKITSSSPNTYMITNPLLPTYLPESLPGVNMGLLFPGLWTRG